MGADGGKQYSDVAAVAEIHETQVVDDVMQMRPVGGGIEIPANGQVRLEPGGYHIMLMDLQRSLVVGKSISVVLVFESGETVTVDAPVQEAPPQP